MGPPTGRGRGRRAASTPALAWCVALALQPGAAHALAAPAGADGAERPDDAVTLTVSGGVSLGAYEAGLTWGLVRFLALTRAGGAGHPGLFRPRLTAVTGASAGAVNALLAAALWCERPERAGRLDDNLLLDAWIDLDLSALLPAGDDGYDPGDGLLAARPLEQAGRRARDALFGPAAAGRFAPGCRVPLGITLTQFEPRQQDVAGLTTSTQRLVVPWSFEVGPDGVAVVRRHPLPRGELADSVLDLDGIPASGAAAPLRPEVLVSALLASAAVPVAFAPRRLCAARDDAAAPDPAGRPAGTTPPAPCDEYVDGGVFDNAPLGLAVDLAEGSGVGSVLHPILSILVDPDRRRLLSAPAEAPGQTGHLTFGRQLRLFGNLLGTARRAELARAIRSRGWNRTTQRVLRDFSAVTAENAELHAALAPLSAAGRAGAVDAPPAARRTDRATFGRTISSCLDRLAGAAARATAGLDPCAAELLAIQVDAAARGDGPLPAGEVVLLAERLAGFLRAVQAGRPGIASGAEAVALQPAFRAGSTVAAAALLFLADEVGRVASSGLDEPVLRRFRAAVLEPVRRSDALVRATATLLGGLLAGELDRVGQAAPPSVAAEAARARAALAALPPGTLFDVDLLQDTVEAAARAEARGEWETLELAGALRRLLALVEARSRFAGLSSRLAALRQQAVELAEGSGAERRLAVSSRFAPLAGAQLGGFAGFLDRPLRRYDYYAGVYEATHAIAVALCASQPPHAGLEPPARRVDDPSELDLGAPATQRCLGRTMRGVVVALGVEASPQGRHVVAALAGLELAASLGRSSRALLLRGEPAWSWLDALAAPSPGDPVEATLEALTSARSPCRPGEEEPLCPAELDFDGFLAALAAQGYRPGSPALALALRDQEQWWAEVLERLARRALTVERRAAGPAPSPLSEAVTTGLSAAELLARRAAARGPPPRLLLDPSTIPASPPEELSAWRLAAAHAIPYRLSLDLARGGFALAWLEPELVLGRHVSLVATLEPVGLRPSPARWSSAAGALVVFRAGGLSLGAGPRWWSDWGGAAGLGVEARAAVLQDRVALGVGLREPGARSTDRGFFVTLSVSDLNGLAWWLTPLGGGT